MPQFVKSMRVPYSPSDSFDLISDIRSYPRFIRWITALRVRNERTIDHGVTECDSDVLVGFKGFVERFSTHVRMFPDDGLVEAALINGPFEHLHASWKVTASSEESADISLRIDYEFNNPLIGMFARANQNIAADRILAAFLAEARRRYGPSARDTQP